MARPHQDDLAGALRSLVERCPRLSALCYWARTAAIAGEELGHRASYDLDFHTHDPLVDVRPLLAEVEAAFPGQFELTRPPDEFGSAFQGVLVLEGSPGVTLEVLSGFEAVPALDLVPSSTAPGICRVTLRRYLADKVQCVVERAEARDLVDIGAVLSIHPELEPAARRFLSQQDAALLAERLLHWSDEALRDDLALYPDVPIHVGLVGCDASSIKLSLLP